MTSPVFQGFGSCPSRRERGKQHAGNQGLMMQASRPARIRFAYVRSGLLSFGLTLSFAAAGAPPPLPPPPLPPLPAAAQPGGAQPVMPPPTIPIPETNLDLSVPPVYERPLGADEGERVFVKRFVI